MSGLTAIDDDVSGVPEITGTAPQQPNGRDQSRKNDEKSTLGVTLGDVAGPAFKRLQEQLGTGEMK